MTVRRMTWAEWDAWVRVTGRLEAQHRTAFVHDVFHASRGETAGLEKHLEALDGHR